MGVAYACLEGAETAGAAGLLGNSLATRVAPPRLQAAPGNCGPPRLLVLPCQRTSAVHVQAHVDTLAVGIHLQDRWVGVCWQAGEPAGS